MLIGNYALFHKIPAKFIGGTTLSEHRPNYGKSGSRYNFYAGEATVSAGASIANKNSFPNGYNNIYAWTLSPKAGGLASYKNITASGSVTNSNLAGGLNAESDLTGSGDITTANLGLVVSAVAALIGSGSISADIIGALEAEAALTGSGTVSTGNLGALADLVSSLSGTGVVSADIIAKGSISSDITVTGDILNTANVAEFVWNGLAEGSLTYQHAVRLLLAIAVGKTDIDTSSGVVVTFRDTTDSTDRVVADMTGSERTTITLDAS